MWLRTQLRTLLSLTSIIWPTGHSWGHGQRMECRAWQSTPGDSRCPNQCVYISPGYLSVSGSLQLHSQVKRPFQVEHIRTLTTPPCLSLGTGVGEGQKSQASGSASSSPLSLYHGQGGSGTKTWYLDLSGCPEEGPLLLVSPLQTGKAPLVIAAV